MGLLSGLPSRRVLRSVFSTDKKAEKEREKAPKKRSVPKARQNTRRGGRTFTRGFSVRQGGLAARTGFSGLPPLRQKPSRPEATVKTENKFFTKNGGGN